MKKTKKILSIILSICMLLIITAGLDFSAYALPSSGSCGANLTWNYNANTKELSISGTGDMASYWVNEDGSAYPAPPWYEYQSSIKSLKISNGVTSISDTAFINAINLSTITLPSTLKKIGYEAFYKCVSLKSVVLPEGLESIDDYAFFLSQYITSFSIPSTLKSIGRSALGGLPRLEKFNVSSSSKYFKSIAGMIYTYDGKTLVQCPAGYVLTEITIPNGVEIIGDSAFDNLQYTSKIVLPETLKRIGNGSFFAARSLVSITIPASVKTIGSSPFEYCSSLNTVTVQSKNCIYGYHSENFQSDSNIFPSNVTLYGYTNSTTDALAKKYNYRFVSIGIIEKGKVHGNFKAGGTKYTGDYGYYYEDEYFKKPSTEFNQSLATMSLCMALSTYQTKTVTYGNVKDLMEECEFENFKAYNYSKTPTTDSIGCAISEKNVDGKKLIAVAVRSGGYGAEWSSNAQVGLTGDHTGFNSAANKVVADIKDYIKSKSITGDVKIWITGYSRGAATATQTAAKLNSTSISGVSFSKSDIYCYGFATPAGANKKSNPHSSKYDNIFNIINYHDLVPLVAPSNNGWSFDRYGVSKLLPFYENSVRTSPLEAKMKKYYTSMTGKKYKVDDFNSGYWNSYASLGAFNRKLIKDVASALGTRETYVAKYQNDAMMYLSKTDDGKFLAITDLLTKNLLIFADLAQVNPVSLGTAIENKDYLVEAHDQDGAYYVAWMQLMDSNYGQNVPVTYNNGDYRVVKVNCPVDVYVIDESENTIASIINDSINNTEDSTVSLEIDENAQKLVYLPVDSDYKVNVVARENCKTTISINEYSGVAGDVSKVIAYDSIAMKAKEEVSLDVEQYSKEDISLDEGTTEGSTAEYDLMNKSTQVIKPTVNVCGEEVADYIYTVTTSYPKTYGSVVGGGVYTIGDFAQVEAQAVEGCVFDGWYVNNKLVSTDNTYRFAVDADVNIVAKFTEIEHKWVDTVVSPTCTKKGYINSECKICGATFKSNYVAMASHTNKTTTTPATTKSAGKIVSKCINCGKIKSTKAINKIGKITLSKSTYIYDGRAKKPTVTVKGSDGKTIAATNYTVTYPSGRKNVGKYTVKITFKGNYSGTISKTFVINPKNTSISKLTATKGGFKATIKKYTTQTTGYQIRYSTKSNMSGAKTVTIAKNTTTSKSVTGLSKGKKYYVQIRTFKTVNGTKYYSAWSGNKTVTTKK